jgi:cyclophilin family peptidyl-prolyl cis-trans isomerase
MHRPLLAALALGLAFAPAADGAAADHPRVRLTTNHGAIVLELYPDKAPKTVENFLAYVKSGQYAGTIFHRVIRGFMIQGGGFEPGLHQKSVRAPIQNEADNGVRNKAGTIAMARTGDPHSATAQFFINTVDNAFLDHRGKSAEGWGYAVFGAVVEGMEVVREIEKVDTQRVGRFDDVPVKDVVIEKAEAIK